jgi:hypothetical protein
MTDKFACEGNCGTELSDARDTWWVRLPDDREFGFCSLDCRASWLDDERRLEIE